MPYFPYLTVPQRGARGWQTGAELQVNGERFSIKCIQLAHSRVCRNPITGSALQSSENDIIILDKIPEKPIESGAKIQYLAEAPARELPKPEVKSRTSVSRGLPQVCKGVYPDCSNLSEHAIPLLGVPAGDALGWRSGARVSLGAETFEIRCVQLAMTVSCVNPKTNQPLNFMSAEDLIVLDRWPAEALPAGAHLSYSAD